MKPDTLCPKCGGPTIAEGDVCRRSMRPIKNCPGERRSGKDRRSPQGEEAETEDNLSAFKGFARKGGYHFHSWRSVLDRLENELGRAIVVYDAESFEDDVARATTLLGDVRALRAHPEEPEPFYVAVDEKHVTIRTPLGTLTYPKPVDGRYGLSISYDGIAQTLDVSQSPPEAPDRQFAIFVREDGTAETLVEETASAIARMMRADGIKWMDVTDDGFTCGGLPRESYEFFVSRPPQGEEAETECPDDCAMCDGEFCATHGADPCDCDTADRHFSRPPQGERQGYGGGHVPRLTDDSVALYSRRSRRCPISCGPVQCRREVGHDGMHDGYFSTLDAMLRSTSQGAEPDTLVRWIDEVITEHQGPSAWLPDTMQVPTQLLRQVRSRIRAQGAEVEAAICELEAEVTACRGLDVMVELRFHSAVTLLAALRAKGGADGA